MSSSKILANNGLPFSSTTIGAKNVMDVNLEGGSSAVGGQSGPGLILGVTVTTSPVDITQALIDAGILSFNAQNIQNQSGIEIEFNYASSWTYGLGWKIPDGTNEYRDLTHEEHVYLMAATTSAVIFVEGIGDTQ